jgi:hypothetical protein
MKNIIFLITSLTFLSGCSEKKLHTKDDYVIADGQMPWLTIDKSNALQIVYGQGDSIMYSYSSDNGNTFSKPALIAALPHAYSFAMRGPQIATAKNGITVTACTSLGDIYSFYKEDGGNWIEGRKVNDVDTVAKEGLMSLSADGENVFAAWLDLRGNKRNKIYGARSIDGGKTWLKNILVYASPDSSVCECCKPSVVVKGSHVYVMFRNWLQGNRDLYLAESNNGGDTFGQAQKLGTGNWQLNGCPMDGGSLAVSQNGQIETVWRRKSTIYTAMPRMPEKEIGKGRSCTIETVNNKNVYAWTENEDVIFINPQGQKKILGKGSQPVLKALNKGQVICVWENDKQIHVSVLAL